MRKRNGTKAFSQKRCFLASFKHKEEEVSVGKIGTTKQGT
jgi:hypothetical protein